jgi:hypothetical protein
MQPVTMSEIEAIREMVQRHEADRGHTSRTAAAVQTEEMAPGVTTALEQTLAEALARTLYYYIDALEGNANDAWNQDQVEMVSEAVGALRLAGYPI